MKLEICLLWAKKGTTCKMVCVLFDPMLARFPWWSAPWEMNGADSDWLIVLLTVWKHSQTVNYGVIHTNTETDIFSLSSSQHAAEKSRSLCTNVLFIFAASPFSHYKMKKGIQIGKLSCNSSWTVHYKLRHIWNSLCCLLGCHSFWDFEDILLERWTNANQNPWKRNIMN